MSRSNLSVNSAGSSSGHDQHMYIYELPLSVRQALCQHLDELKVWPQLAKFMSLKEREKQLIKNKEEYGKSPTDEILKIWGGQYNHTVTELFVVLHKHHLHQAMRIIKDFVGRKYHYLIPNSQPLFSDLLAANSKKDGKVGDITQKLLNCSVSTSSGVSNSNNNDDDDDDTDQSNSTSAQNHQKGNASNSEYSISLTEDSIQKYASSILEINYSELCEATNNWNESNILGKGGFGTVYRGYWKHTDVAIKLMHYKRPNGIENVKVQIQQSLNELKFMNACRHDNILPLYGYSIKGDKPCLVYQLMMGGSLEERLTAKNCEPMAWKKRVNICLGTARGINFLHTYREKPLIHGDIKPANILLDQCLTPKIGDFGLAREGPNAINTAVEVTQVFGTKFYLPQEFIHSKQLSTKVDTFSFGVVLLELFTGMRAYNKQRAENLNVFIQKFCQANGGGPEQLQQLIERKVPLAIGELEMCQQMLQLGLSCTADSPEMRPEMVQVLELIREMCLYFRVPSY